MRVYHLRHEDSAETDKFQAGLERERRALESLIHAKGHMVLPMLPDPKQVRRPGSMAPHRSSIGFKYTQPKPCSF